MPRQPRPIRIEGDVAYVPLTKGYEAVIDAADVPLVASLRWNTWRRMKDGRQVGGTYAIGSSRADKTVYLHRLILNAPKGMDVDHIDGDGLNNRRSNLRLATRSQNCMNRRASGKPKGVFPVGSRWMARIGVAGEEKYLGVFESVDAAAAAYAKASAELHGEFGRLG